MSGREPLGSTQRLTAFRKPQRISITIPQSEYEYLVKKSAYEGRSLSNYASFLLERSVQEK